jgi:hypothetical protein
MVVLVPAKTPSKQTREAVNPEQMSRPKSRHLSESRSESRGQEQVKQCHPKTIHCVISSFRWR